MSEVARESLMMPFIGLSDKELKSIYQTICLCDYLRNLSEEGSEYTGEVAD
jgi:hypothetical protein